LQQPRKLLLCFFPASESESAAKKDKDRESDGRYYWSVMWSRLSHRSKPIKQRGKSESGKEKGWRCDAMDVALEEGIRSRGCRKGTGQAITADSPFSTHRERESERDPLV
jgi:hypothetical protein